jgi:hypothetical protein
VHHSRAFFGFYYVSRTTHDGVIAQLSPCYKEIVSLGGTSISVVYPIFLIAKGKSLQIIEEYRTTLRSLYNAYYGEEGLKNPTAEEWAAFVASCNLRDMGTHLCALPTGEYCPKGLICLGCAHAQPKKSAVPIFRRTLASHERRLVAARGHSEPCRTDRGPRDGNCQDQGSVAESGGIER